MIEHASMSLSTHESIWSLLVTTATPSLCSVSYFEDQQKRLSEYFLVIGFSSYSQIENAITVNVTCGMLNRFNKLPLGVEPQSNFIVTKHVC